MAKKKKASVKTNSNGKIRKIDVEQILLGKRQIYIFEDINEKLAQNIVKQLMALDKIKHTPIVLYINSCGGSCSDGFAIIDTMKRLIHSPVFTFVIGSAYSMAGLISIAGDYRLISQNSSWMAHDGSAGWRGKFKDGIDYAKHIEALQSQIFTYLRKHTNLSEEDLDKAKAGQLWLTPDQCLEKGVVDQVVAIGERKTVKIQKVTKQNAK